MNHDDNPAKCPMDSLLRLLSGPWTTSILWVLRRDGPTRFGELRRKVSGISARILTERLRKLEAGGLIYRDYQPSVPPKVSYGLSARGLELQAVFDELSRVAGRWAGQEGKADS